MITLIKQWYSGVWNVRLMVVAGLLFGMYSFFIVATVVTVNDRKDIRIAIRDTQAQVADLEISYFNLASGVDMQKASSLGFVNAAVPQFVYAGQIEEKVAVNQ